MTEQIDASLVWFRRDLRCTDHAALYYALKGAKRVWCAFVLDTDILDPLPRQDRRVSFILKSLQELHQGLQDLSRGAGGLVVRHGSSRDVIPRLAAQLGVQAVFANHDDDPMALARDAAIRGKLSDIGAALYTTKDHVIFERNEVLTGQGTPYGVFTPYKKAWLNKVDDFYLKPYPIQPYANALAPIPADLAGWHVGGMAVPSEADIGFEPCPDLKIPCGMSGAQQLLDDFLHRIEHYHETRDFPGVKGPSYLSTHLRFGTLSIRQAASMAHKRAQLKSEGAQTWLSELIWRDFYHQILFHHPHVIDHSYKREYDKIKWASGATANAHFKAWCQGLTGYPLVDAAMRQLNQTGYMHNRLRMVTASFLTKDLGIDWRRGAAYFAEQLLDFDLAANNGGWQWAASTGCDAQPYFRIFNPISQSKKFDPAGKFIRRYVPELAELPDAAIHAPWLAGFTPSGYPAPIVDHDVARADTLKRFEVVKKT
ncbi:MAG: deoxyribodipyrimidine photo-lyase [Burkholderiales bacterium]|nr:deoxyribodipyrimidine photo-lyase [Burkholderiales bacterium]